MFIFHTIIHPMLRISSKEGHIMMESRMHVRYWRQKIWCSLGHCLLKKESYINSIVKSRQVTSYHSTGSNRNGNWRKVVWMHPWRMRMVVMLVNVMV